MFEELVVVAPVKGPILSDTGPGFSFPPSDGTQLFAMRSKVFTRAIRVLIGGVFEAVACPEAVGIVPTGIDMGGREVVADGGASSKSPHPSSSSAGLGLLC